MAHRRAVRLLPLGALLVLAAISFLSVLQPATKAATEADGPVAETRQRLTGVELEWNRYVTDATRPASVRVTTHPGQSFEAEDRVDVTAVGTGDDSCTSKAIVAKKSSVVDVTFQACGVMLWDIQGVKVSVQPHGADASSSSVVRTAGDGESFEAGVVDTGADVTASHTTKRQPDTETLDTIGLAVSGATVEQLLGKRLVAVVPIEPDDTVTYSGRVGDRASHQGVWVQDDPATGTADVMVDVTVVSRQAGPDVVDGAQYRVLLLQPQGLGDLQTHANRYAVTTATGVLELSEE